MRRSDSRRGQSLVELALCVPLLLMLLCTIIEYGFLLYQTARVAEATREGARFGAQRQLDTAIKDRIVSHLPDLNPSNALRNAITIQEKTQAGVDVAANTRSSGNRLEVTVTYTLRTLTPLGAVFHGYSDRVIKANAIFCVEN